MSKEAMKLALEALETIWYHVGTFAPTDDAIELYDQARTSLRQALAKQEQGEPVAYIHRNEYNEYRLEPHDNFEIKSIPFNVDVPLYPTQKRTWVGLTDEDRQAAFESMPDMLDGFLKKWGWLHFSKALEAKLKEKNT
jgi:plasmid stabilization system protein ParE